MRSGQGTLTYTDNTSYEGIWHMKTENYGSLTLPDIPTNLFKSYEGNWLNRKQHGQGVEKDWKGNTYDGEWKNGKKIWTWNFEICRWE